MACNSQLSANANAMLMSVPGLGAWLLSLFKKTLKAQQHQSPGGRRTCRKAEEKKKKKLRS